MAETFKFTDERFADIQMLRYRLDGFEDLTLKQKLYIYYLAKATLCGRDVVTIFLSGRPWRLCMRTSWATARRTISNL